MEFGFEIEKEKYTLFIGWPSKNLESVFYIFDGWSDSEQKKRFFGSVDYFSQEVGARRTELKLVGADIFTTKSTANEIKGKGTLVGGIIKVNYNKLETNQDRIDDFFKNSGIMVRHANLFFKPVKSIWQVFKERFVKK